MNSSFKGCIFRGFQFVYVNLFVSNLFISTVPEIDEIGFILCVRIVHMAWKSTHIGFQKIFYDMLSKER